MTAFLEHASPGKIKTASPPKPGELAGTCILHIALAKDIKSALLAVIDMKLLRRQNRR